MSDRQTHSRTGWFPVKQRWWMLLVAVVVCLLVALVGLWFHSAWRQQVAVMDIERAGGVVKYSYLMRIPGSEPPAARRTPWVPQWLRERFDPHFFDAVQTVHFGDPNSGDLPSVGDEAMQRLRWFPELREVGLWSTEVSDDGLKELERLRKLRHVTLGRNQNISDEGMKSIGRLGQLNSLEIYGRQVTDEGLKYLGEMKSLTYLHISGANVTDEGLVHLERIGSLRQLILERTGATPEGVARLRRALPDCGILLR
jgi:hypothetical protein